MLGLPVQLVACAGLDCVYNWLLRLYRQRKHRQPVTHAAKAQATSSTSNQSTGNQDPRAPELCKYACKVGPSALELCKYACKRGVIECVYVGMYVGMFVSIYSHMRSEL